MRFRIALLTASVMLSGSATVPAQVATKGAPSHVYAAVRKTFQNAYDISESSLGIFLYVNAFGSGFSFSGRPFSGSIYGSGNWMNISAAGLNATVNSWGNAISVQATVHGGGGAPAGRIDFTLYSSGRTDDPRFPPSYSLYSPGANLYISPNGNQDYTVSGTVGPEFGAEGTALVGLVLAARMHERRPPGQGIQRPAILDSEEKYSIP